MNNNLKIAYLFILIGISCGCSKVEFLGTPSDKSLVIPTTLKDFQGILDNDKVMNGCQGEKGLIPAMGEMGSDNYYISEYGWNNYADILNSEQQNIYTWAQQIYTGNEVYDWDNPYRSILYCNIVLDGMDNFKKDASNIEEANNITGSALFYRAHLFYQLAQVFAAPYDKNTADTVPGIPLRMKADVNEPLHRAPLKEVYEKVITDLKTSATLLPVTPLYKTRPSKPAAYALLARVYQTMGEYDSSLQYADSSIQLYNNLLDYNDLNPEDFYPISRYNQEVIFACNLVYQYAFLLAYGVMTIDSTLYQSYEPGDLRKHIFFIQDDRGNTGFRGSYDGYFPNFAGLATDEVYLIKAECLARKGDVGKAMEALNTLLQKRWQKDSFTPLEADNPTTALNIILEERRKELIFRGLRWTDLRRLNKEGTYNVTLKRSLNGENFELPPNSPRYTYPIPTYIINFHTDWKQNQR